MYSLAVATTVNFYVFPTIKKVGRRRRIFCWFCRTIAIIHSCDGPSLTVPLLLLLFFCTAVGLNNAHSAQSSPNVWRDRHCTHSIPSDSSWLVTLAFFLQALLSASWLVFLKKVTHAWSSRLCEWVSVWVCECVCVCLCINKWVRLSNITTMFQGQPPPPPGECADSTQLNYAQTMLLNRPLMMKRLIEKITNGPKSRRINQFLVKHSFVLHNWMVDSSYFRKQSILP